MRKRLHTKKCGDGTILTMILVFFVLTLTVTVGEYYRMNLLHQEVEYQLQRAVNCAVEYAMGDSYRQDKITSMDVTVAKSELYQYLLKDVGLDSMLRKYKNGKFSYRLYVTQVEGSRNPARLTVRGRAEADTLFSFLAGRVRIPFCISSTNFRTD